MPNDEIKALLKAHPHLTNALFGSLLLAQAGVISPLANHVGSGGP